MNGAHMLATKWDKVSGEGSWAQIYTNIYTLVSRWSVYNCRLNFSAIYTHAIVEHHIDMPDSIKPKTISMWGYLLEIPRAERSGATGHSKAWTYQYALLFCSLCIALPHSANRVKPPRYVLLTFALNSPSRKPRQLSRLG